MAISPLRLGWKSSLIKLFYNILVAIFDGYRTFMAPPRRLPPKQSSDIDHLTDEQVLGLCYAVPSEAWDMEESPTGMLPYITSCIVAKSMLIPVDGMPSEALILNLVHEATNIPVPQVRRVVTSPCKAVILMDYIPGARLSDVWHELSLFRKIRVAMTLRSYILQLRSIRHPRALIPGPMASGNMAMTCWSPRIFGTMIDSRGPFASYDDLSSFFNTRQTMSLGASSELENFDDSSHLVLVHHDLNMRNIILGDDGQIWLVCLAFTLHGGNTLA